MMHTMAVIGVGNILCQDEGIGVHIVNTLKKDYACLPYDFIDGGTGGISVLNIIKPYKKVVIIDALKSGAKPGSVIRIEKPETRLQKPEAYFSLHQTDISLLLEIISYLGIAVDITFIGIVPSSINYGNELSLCIKESFESIIKQVVGMLEEGIR